MSVVTKVVGALVLIAALLLPLGANIVVVATAGLYSSDMQAWVPLQILNRHVLAAVRPE